MDHYQRARHRGKWARVEFNHFQATATNEHVVEVAGKWETFHLLKSHFGFYRWPDEPDRLQVNFGKRNCLAMDGSTYAEHGAALVYSIGGGGIVTIQLHPAHSEWNSMHEKHLLLHIGQLSALRLKSRFSKDLKTFVRYADYTSADGDHRLRHRLWYRWLVFWSDRNVEGKFTRGGWRRIGHLTWSGVFTIGSWLVQNAFTILLIVVLTGLGYNWVADLL